MRTKLTVPLAPVKYRDAAEMDIPFNKKAT